MRIYVQRRKIVMVSIISILLAAMAITIFILYHRWDSAHKEKSSMRYIPNVKHEEDWNSIVTGKKVKEALLNWSEESPLAILVTTQELLIDRECDEIAYLKYALDSYSRGKNKKAASGNNYMLCYVNYGNVLYDSCIIQRKSSAYYTLYGYLQEDIMDQVFDDQSGEISEVVAASKTHPWTAEGISIPEDEVYEMEEIYDGEDKLIGVVYTPSILDDTKRGEHLKE